MNIYEYICIYMYMIDSLLATIYSLHVNYLDISMCSMYSMYIYIHIDTFTYVYIYIHVYIYIC